MSEVRLSKYLNQQNSGLDSDQKVKKLVSLLRDDGYDVEFTSNFGAVNNAVNGVNQKETYIDQDTFWKYVKQSDRMTESHRGKKTFAQLTEELNEGYGRKPGTPESVKVALKNSSLVKSVTENTGKAYDDPDGNGKWRNYSVQLASESKGKSTISALGKILKKKDIELYSIDIDRQDSTKVTVEVLYDNDGSVNK